MDYEAIKAADAALGIADPGDAAAALNAQTITVQGDVATSDARSAILPTGEYGALVLLADTRDFTTTPRQLVVAAITAIATFDSNRVVKADDAAAWNGVQSMLGAFVSAGVVSAASRDAILAMRTQTVPKWPMLDAGIIQTARGQL
jgi:hypothetical protein